MKLFNKLLLATVVMLCIITGSLAQKTINTDQSSTFLGPKSLTFRAFDNNLNGTDSDYIILTNTVFIHYGTKFSLTNANFSIRDTGNVWLPNQGSELATVEFEYLGLDPIPPGSNLCVFIGPEGIVDVIDIFLDGHPNPNTFNITGNSTASINLPTTTTSTIYITQGTWNEPQPGEFTLGGNVVDGLGIGITDTEWQAAGMPGELDPHGGGVGTGGGGSGDYWGVLQCDGLIYVCDYLSLQPYVDNWFISQGGDLGDPHSDTSELCEELCDLLCSDCDFEVQIEIEYQRYPFPDCIIKAGAIGCEPPFNYEWQKKVNDEWISIIIGTSQDGSIPNYENTYKDNEYRLVVRCTEYCIKESNIVTNIECPEEPCLASITSDSTYCHFEVTVTGCNTATYQWFELIDGAYILIPNATASYYTADHGGDYKVFVGGCNRCDELYWDFHIEPMDIKTIVESVELCSYRVCILTTADSILNITVLAPDILKLNTLPSFNFEYPATNLGYTALGNDINSWFDDNGYFGHAFLYSICPKGIELIVINTDIEFVDITWSKPEGDGGGEMITTKPWEEFGCHDEDIGFRLIAIPDCDDYQSIIWSTGETGESIIVESEGTYSATVDCGNGCLMTESITITNNDDPQTLIANNGNEPISISLPKNTIVKESNFKVYPNPGQGLYTVELYADGFDFLSLSLYTTTGKMVKTFPDIKLDEGNVKTSIDIQEFQSGIYILKVNELSTNNVSKLILIK